MAFSSLISKAITRYSNNMFDAKKVNELSDRLEADINFKLKEGDSFENMNTPNFKEPDYTDSYQDMDIPFDDLEDYYSISDNVENIEELEDYVDLSIKILFREKNDKTLDELRQMPEFQKDSESYSWEDFSRARGYSEEDIQDFKTVMEQQEKLDPAGDIGLTITDGIQDLTNRFFMLKRKTEDDAVVPEQYKKFLPFVREMFATNGDYQNYLSPDSTAAAARNALVELLSDENTKRVLDDMLDELPKAREYKERVTDKAQIVSAEEFVADSVQKLPQFYRAVTSFNDLTYDLSFVWPREIGTHVGTRGQASNILVRGINPDRTDIHLYTADRKEKPTSKDLAAFFEDEGEALQEYAAYGEDINIPPATMMRGYINTKNPLVIQEDFGRWESYEILADPVTVETFREAIESQNVKLTNSQELELDGLVKRAENISNSRNIDPALEGREYEFIKTELLGTELGKDFRSWLESLGFDSIKYRNQAEASLRSENEYSYVLFRPEQYKSYTATDFDPSRKEFAEGGYVIKSGDTLSQIAKDNNTTVAELARLNGIKDVNKIYAGQKLNLGQQVEEAMKPEPKKAPEKPQKAPEPEKEDEGFNLNVDFAKQFVRGFFKTGDQETEDFSDKLRSVLRDAARNANRKGQDYITYKEYPQLASGESADDWVKGRRSGGFLDKLRGVFTDPVLNAAVTVGQGNLVRENGRVYFTDEYDFTPIEKDYSELGAYGKVRKWAGENFPEDGNKIRIDLGPEEEVYGRPEVAMDQQDTDTQEV